LGLKDLLGLSKRVFVGQVSAVGDESLDDVEKVGTLLVVARVIDECRE